MDVDAGDHLSFKIMWKATIHGSGFRLPPQSLTGQALPERQRFWCWLKQSR
jgi:hypothetical protein